MENLVTHRPKALLLAGALLALCLTFLVSSPPKASAAESNYCYGKNLSGYSRCVGVARNLNAVYGSGWNHSVCVWASPESYGSVIAGTSTCSSGPSAGTYNNSMGYAYYYPVIQNNAAGANTVYGVAYRP
jgi:hypothetical protein